MSGGPQVLRAGSAVIDRERIATPTGKAPEAMMGRRRPRARGFDRPRFLPIITALVFVYLFSPIITGSLFASIEIALVTMVVSTVIGTLLAFGLVRARSRLSRPTDILMLLNLVSPEVVTGVALLLVFSAAGGVLS